MVQDTANSGPASANALVEIEFVKIPSIKNSLLITEIAESRTYVRLFHTGYGMFHCDPMTYDLMLH